MQPSEVDVLMVEVSVTGGEPGVKQARQNHKCHVMITETRTCSLRGRGHC